MNPPKLTILAADTDAACDPETGDLHHPADANPVTWRGAGNRRGPSGHGGDSKRLTWPARSGCGDAAHDEEDAGRNPG